MKEKNMSESQRYLDFLKSQGYGSGNTTYKVGNNKPGRKQVVYATA